MEHNYKDYPELTNTELETMRLTSPHEQIESDFVASVVKVHDGDTITLRTQFRDFDFPLRFLNINAPELSEEGGKESGDWLREQIEGQEVQILINVDNRVDKYGRLLGEVVYLGINLNESAVLNGKATPFDNRNDGKIPVFEKIINEVAF